MMYLQTVLRFVDSFHRTYIHTRGTIRTKFRVNNIDITFGNSFFWTFINACSASSTIISYYMSHLYENLS